MSLVLYIVATYILFFWLFNRVVVRESRSQK
jgi:hypothetical protein